MQFNFSTTGIRESDRFAYWRDVVCQYCIPAASESPYDKVFEAKIAGHSLGPLFITNMIAQEHSWTRSSDEIRKGPESSLWLSFMESGTGQLEQGGKSVVQNSGDIVLYDASRPFKYNLNPLSFYILRIPRELLTHRTGAAERLVATALGAGTGLSSVLGSLVKSVSGNPVLIDEPCAASHVSSSILDLLACIIDLHGGGQPAHTVADALFRRACGYIHGHINDPELSALTVARSEHVSPRTLARTFAAHGTTPMRYIWRKRLEASYCAIAQGSARKVSDAAMDYGFSDLSHFSRAFKKSFGVSPQTLLLRR